MSVAVTGAAPAFAAAIPTSPEPAARSRERLTARPGEGPVGRRQAEGVQLFLGLLPDRNGLFGDVERNLADQRHRLEPRVGADEGFAVGEVLHGIALHETFVVMDSGLTPSACPG